MPEETTVIEPQLDIKSDPGFQAMKAKIAEISTPPEAPPAPAQKEAAKEPVKEPPKEPAKEASKVAEPKANPLELPDGLSSKAAEKFNHIKSERDNWQTKASEADKQLTSLKAEIEKLRVTQSNPAEIESLKKEKAATEQQLQEYSEKLRVLEVTQHPKFKAHFDGRQAQVIAFAKKVAGENGDAVEKILKLPDSEFRREKINEVMASMEQLDATQLANAVSQLDMIEMDRQNEIAKAGESHAALKAQEAAETQKQLAEVNARKASWLKQVLDLAKTNYDGFKEREGDAEHNAGIAAREGLVKAFFDEKLAEKDLAMMPVLAAEAIFLREKELPLLRDENKNLKAQIAELSAARPGVSVGSKKGESAVPQTDDPAADWKELMRKAQAGELGA